MAPYVVSTYIYLGSVTFSLRPDEAASVWRQQKLVFKNVIYCFVSAPRRYCIMDTNKVSNLFSFLRDKYGGDNVELLRYWDITVKKMVDYRNHRRFTLRCIKLGITPASCWIRNPLKIWKSYHIIHKAKKLLLYEIKRNINKILYMYENKKAEHYSKPRSLIQDQDISKCILLFNKIKEYRHNKIKVNQ